MTPGNVGSVRYSPGEDAHRRIIGRREDRRSFPRPGLLTERTASDDGGNDRILGTSFQVVGNASIDLAAPGRYLVIGIFDFDVTVTGVGIVSGALFQDGADVDVNRYARFTPTDTDQATIMFSWIVEVSSVPSTVDLRAKKSIGAGTVTAKAARTRITVTSVLGGGSPASPGIGTHGSGSHTDKIGEVPLIIPIPLKQPLANGTLQAAVDYEHRDWGNGEARINRIYARARSNVGGDVTLKLHRNGSATHASDTVMISSGARESSVTTLNAEITLADGDYLDVEQTTSRTDDIAVDFYVLGDQDVVAAV